jgi:hypothetical protein
MNRLLGLVSILAFSASAFAFTGHNSDWKGGGYWKGADGTKGKWTSKSSVTHGKDGYTVKESTTIYMPDGKTTLMEEEWTAKSSGNGFLTLTKNGKDHGTGYCGYKQCHIQGEGWEETVTFHKGKMFRIGSHSDKDHTIMWQGGMKPVKKAKAKKGKKGGCTDCTDCGDCCDEAKGCTDSTECADCKK